ncbi:MAG TPA: hypothetical protein VFE62_07280 [Gemmataceae bacterium]|nr:hypothetical protein [Gemmataceae bacterium]
MESAGKAVGISDSAGMRSEGKLANAPFRALREISFTNRTQVTASKVSEQIFPNSL